MDEKEKFEFSPEEAAKILSLQNKIEQLVSEKNLDGAIDVYMDFTQETGLPPNIHIINDLLRGNIEEENYLRVQQLEQAINVYRLEMTPETLQLLVNGHTKNNDVLKAEKIFYKYKKQSDNSTKIPILVFGDLIKSFCNKGKVEEAYEMIKLILHQKDRPTLEMYNMIVTASARLKNTSLVWKCLLELKELQIAWDVHSWNGFISTLCGSGKLDEALKQFYQLQSKNNIEPNSETYSILVIAMTKEKRILPAENLFIQMRNKGLEISQNVWRYVIEGFARSKQLEKAFILVDQMQKEGVEVKGPILNILLTQCERKGRLELYKSRFGEPKYTTRRRDYNITLRDNLITNLDNVNWDLEGDPFSVLSEQKKRKEEEEKKYQKRLKDLEDQFLENIPQEFGEELLESQRKLAEERKKKTTLPKSSNPPKKKSTQGPTKRAPKPNPFTAIDELKNQKKKRLTTPKDTRRPRSQFMTGRHMGPKK